MNDLFRSSDLRPNVCIPVKLVDYFRSLWGGRILRLRRRSGGKPHVRHLLDFRTPMEFELHRIDAGKDGNLEGFYHKGIVGAAQWWYENPFLPAQLYDDEIAVGTCLEKMSAYAAGGPDFYSLAEASHDMYLSLMMDQAAEEGKTIEVQPRAWAK